MLQRDGGCNEAVSEDDLHVLPVHHLEPDAVDPTLLCARPCAAR